MPKCNICGGSTPTDTVEPVIVNGEGQAHPSCARYGSPERSKGNGSGRFQKGNACGRGRPSGSRNKASMLVEKMLADEAGMIAKTAIDLAKAGDSSMLKCCMERLLPPQRTRPVDLSLPNMTKASDLPRVTATVLNAVASGVLYPSEARELVGVISAHQRSLELAEIERRLDALEANTKQ